MTWLEKLSCLEEPDLSLFKIVRAAIKNTLVKAEQEHPCYSQKDADILCWDLPHHGIHFSSAETVLVLTDLQTCHKAYPFLKAPQAQKRRFGDDAWLKSSHFINCINFWRTSLPGKKYWTEKRQINSKLLGIKVLSKHWIFQVSSEL